MAKLGHLVGLRSKSLTYDKRGTTTSMPASQVEGPPDFGAELRSDVSNVVVAPVVSIEINPEEARHGSLEERMPFHNVHQSSAMFIP